MHVWVLSARSLTRFQIIEFQYYGSFGRVISGQDVVSAVEQVGSESGVTRVPVVVADSGQLR